MVTLQIGWCLNCPHKIGLHPKRARWMHFAAGPGYLLTVNCFAYAGSTNTMFDRGAFRTGQFKCDCVRPELDPNKPTGTKWVLL